MKKTAYVSYTNYLFNFTKPEVAKIAYLSFDRIAFNDPLGVDAEFLVETITDGELISPQTSKALIEMTFDSGGCYDMEFASSALASQDRGTQVGMVTAVQQRYSQSEREARTTAQYIFADLLWHKKQPFSSTLLCSPLQHEFIRIQGSPREASAPAPSVPIDFYHFPDFSKLKWDDAIDLRENRHYRFFREKMDDVVAQVQLGSLPVESLSQQYSNEMRRMAQELRPNFGWIVLKATLSNLPLVGPLVSAAETVIEVTGGAKSVKERGWMFFLMDAVDIANSGSN